MEKRFSVFTISCLFLMAFILVLGVGSTSSYADTYQYTIDSGSYEIVDAGDGYQEIEMEGFGQLLEPGKPKLPSKIFTISIPPGTKVVSVEVEGADPTELPGTYTILPASSPMPGNGDEALIQKANEIYDRNYQATYSSDAPYPESRGEFITQGGYRKYNIVDVRFTPFEYKPQSGKLYFYPWATVTITYESDISSEIGEGLLSEDISEVEEKAQGLIFNYEDAQEWYQPLVAPGGPPWPPYEYVIVTTDDLVDYVWPVVHWEMCKGQGVYVATTTWINTNYSGSDLAARIRAFLRDKLSDWSILKVLLVGDLSDVPMRSCYTYKDPWDDNWGYIPTDYYYAELSQSDYYSWDSDHDGRYGEEGQDSIDFIKEVDVGRIPWSDPDTVESICLKMAEYEYSTDTAFKRNVLLPKAFWDSSTDNAWLAYHMWNDFYSGAGYTRWRVFEYGPHYYSTFTRDETLTHSNVVNRWSGGHYGAVCWSGHGSPTSVSYDADYNWHTLIHSDDSDDLNDNYPSVIYSNSCSTAYPENSNNLGKQMLEHGGVAFVGSTRVMYYYIGWDAVSDGWGNTLAYWFSDYSRYNGSNSIGWSHQRALRKMYTDYGWNNHWFSMFEYVLYGNPDLWVRARPSSLPNLAGSTDAGWSYPIVPRSNNTAAADNCLISPTLYGNMNNTYWNWTYINNGTETAPYNVTRLYLDGVYLYGSWISWLDAGKHCSDYGSFLNNGPRTVRGGRHSVWYNLDDDEQVWETSESDNWWGRQFVWSPYGLSDDVPIYRSAPPTKNAWASPYWYNNDGFSFYVAQSHPNKWWSAVGVLPYNSGADYDVRLWDIGDYTGSEGGFGGGCLEYSSYSGSASDFVIVNDNRAPAGTYYAGVINDNDGTGNFHIEEATSTKISSADTNGPYSMTSTAVLDIYEYYIPTAGDYGIKLEQTSGTCDLGMSLYDNGTVHCQKSEYMTGGYANSSGDGGDEFMQVTIPDSGYHGLVVWKVDSSDYSKTASYNIKVGKCATPGTPSNPSPADGAINVDVNADLNWNDCTNTEYYEVWLSEDYGTWVKLGETETSAWTLPTLNEATHYDWFVRAWNICGTSVFVYWDFTTEDNTPPEPDPMTWATEPYGVSTSSISMVATTATDDTPPVEYYFLCVTADGNSSGWQTSTLYTDSGLPVNTWCGYRVMARDSAAPPNVTAYSSGSRYAYTLANLPGSDGFSNITQTSIRANWTANGNPAGTQYYCENTTAGTNSGWTTNTYWNSAGLDPDTTYSFRVRAINGVGVETGWTSLGSEHTLPAGDPCEGDFDHDKDVDGSDLAVFAADFGRTDCDSGPPCEGDFDSDGDVDGSDLAVFAADFGRTDCP